MQGLRLCWGSSLTWVPLDHKTHNRRQLREHRTFSSMRMKSTYNSEHKMRGKFKLQEVFNRHSEISAILRILIFTSHSKLKHRKISTYLQTMEMIAYLIWSFIQILWLLHAKVLINKVSSEEQPSLEEGTSLVWHLKSLTLNLQWIVLPPEVDGPTIIVA
jgi:hypothetical protein